MDSEYQEALEMVQTLEKKHNEMDEERYEITNELKKQQDLLTQRERELAELMKDYEYAKDKEAVLNADRYSWGWNTIDSYFTHGVEKLVQGSG